MAALMRSPSLFLCIFLAGCAGFKEAREYRDATVVRFMDSNDNWRIFDKPDEGRLMITTSLGRAAGLGLTNPIGGDFPKPEYQSAAAGWLVSTGRQCTITDGYLLVRPQWEFKYSCNGQ